MGTFRPSRVVLVVMLLLASTAGGAISTADAQVGGASVEVSPATGLVDGQTVQLSGTGFPPATGLTTVQCPPGAPIDWIDCDASTTGFVMTDAAGSFSVEVRAYRYLDNAVDCAAGGCTIGATDDTVSAGTETAFADVPIDERVTVAPTADLIDRSVIQVTGSGYTPDDTVELRSCGPGATSLDECRSNLHYATTDADGSFATTLRVARFLSENGEASVDCTTAACSIGVRARWTTQFVPTHFAEPTDPSVTVAPATGLLDGQVVRLSGTGFPAASSLSTGQCPPGVVDDPFACDLTTVVSVTTDESGSFVLDRPAFRFLMGGTVDCAAGGCVIGATDLVLSAVTPTEFVDAPVDEASAASPSSGLLNGQPVTVTGTGFAPGSGVELRTCGPGATTLPDCSSANPASATAGPDGTVEATIRVLRLVPGPGGTVVDCATAECTIGIQSRSSVQFVPIAFTDVPLPARSLTVTPSTGLRDDQLVQVDGTGFTPDSTLVVGSCRAGTTEPLSTDCLYASFVVVWPDETGSFSTEVRVERFFPSGDCAFVPCAVAVFDMEGRPVGIETLIEFADIEPTPTTIEVEPTGLVDGAEVTITGSGFRPSSTVEVRQCPAAPASPDDCSPTTTTWYVDGLGGFTVTMQVTRVLRPVVGPPIDCAVAACTIGVTNDPFLPVSPPLDIVDPELTVDIGPDATLREGTNEAVAQLTVRCDVATPVSVAAAVTQPGIEGTHVVDGERCTPDAPALVFIPTRTVITDGAGYVLGPAEMSATAAATSRYSADDPPTVHTASSGTVELHDEAAVVATVRALIADPANVELRREVVRAIQVRIRQDPVFRAAWQAMVSED